MPWGMTMLHCLEVLPQVGYFCPTHHDWVICHKAGDSESYCYLSLASGVQPGGFHDSANDPLTKWHTKAALPTSDNTVGFLLSASPAACLWISLGTKLSYIIPLHSPIFTRIIVTVTFPVESHLSFFRELIGVI